MQDTSQMSNYLSKKQWGKANQWLRQERSYLDSRVTYSRIVAHTCFIPMSAVLVFYSWLFYFQAASEKELEAFPIAGVATAFYEGLSQITPGGEPVVFFAVLLLPLVLGLLAGLIFRRLKSKPGSEQPYGLTAIQAAEDMRTKVRELEKLQKKYFSENFPFYYALFAGFFTGGIMIFSSVPGGLNPFKYLLFGLGFDLLYCLLLGLCHALLARLFKNENLPSYPISDWCSILEDAIDACETKNSKKQAVQHDPSYSNLGQSEYYKRKRSEYYAMYTGQAPAQETDEEKIKRLYEEIMDDTTGSGDFGDCY